MTLKKNFGVENSIGKPKVLSHGMNSTWDWYSTNTEGYRERKQFKLLLYICIAHGISLQSWSVCVFITLLGNLVTS